jgi:hypothetical protein
VLIKLLLEWGNKQNTDFYLKKIISIFPFFYSRTLFIFVWFKASILQSWGQGSFCTTCTSCLNTSKKVGRSFNVPFNFFKLVLSMGLESYSSINIWWLAHKESRQIIWRHLVFISDDLPTIGLTNRPLTQNESFFSMSQNICTGKCQVELITAIIHFRTKYSEYLFNHHFYSFNETEFEFHQNFILQILTYFRKNTTTQVL